MGGSEIMDSGNIVMMSIIIAVLAFCYWLGFWFGVFWTVFAGVLLFIGFGAQLVVEEMYP